VITAPGRVCRWLLMTLVLIVVGEQVLIDDYFRVVLNLGGQAIPVNGGIASLGLALGAGVAFLVWLYGLRRQLPVITRSGDTRLVGVLAAALFLAWVATTVLLSEPAQNAANDPAATNWQSLLADAIGIGAAVSTFVFIGRASRLTAGTVTPAVEGPPDEP
jgi:hypothetical protein